MQIICIVLVLVLLYLIIRSILLSSALHKAAEQMEAIEKHPQSNRQLKATILNRKLEELFQRINLIYQGRQSERIAYQRRETQIRQEIENISHDLRTPLTSIMGYVELLKDRDITDEDREEYLDIITKRAKILQGFIQDFYEITRIEGEDYPLLMSLIPVQSMLREALVAYFNEFENRRIQVEIELEDKNCTITADKIQFNRILNNLIQNALKYTKSRFAIKQYSLGGRCIIQFMNDSELMQEEEFNRIFERFYTRDQSRGQGSSGLGLTITKLLAEKMMGKIEARIDNHMFLIELSWQVR